MTKSTIGDERSRAMRLARRRICGMQILCIRYVKIYRESRFVGIKQDKQTWGKWQVW